jgi:hypothetical protein
MEHLVFKKEYQHGLFNYLNVSVPYRATSALTGAGKEGGLYKHQFHYYLALADYLMSHLEKYIIIRYSPYLSKLSFLREIETTHWKYEMVSDDRLGLGVDKGFVNAEDLSKEACQLCYISSLLLLSHLPEDTFGDTVSWVTIFGLNNNRITALRNFLQSPAPPDLSDFMEKGEVFVNVISSKEDAYYNSLLIKSTDDIEQELYSFQNILDPNN